MTHLRSRLSRCSSYRYDLMSHQRLVRPRLLPLGELKRPLYQFPSGSTNRTPHANTVRRIVDGVVLSDVRPRHGCRGEPGAVSEPSNEALKRWAACRGAKLCLERLPPLGTVGTSAGVDV